MLLDFEIENVKLEDGIDGIKILNLPELTEEENNKIDPIVAPTSGLRIQIFDIENIEGNEKFLHNALE